MNINLLVIYYDCISNTMLRNGNSGIKLLLLLKQQKYCRDIHPYKPFIVENWYPIEGVYRPITLRQ